MLLERAGETGVFGGVRFDREIGDDAQVVGAVEAQELAREAQPVLKLRARQRLLLPSLAEGAPGEPEDRSLTRGRRLGSMPTQEVADVLVAVGAELEADLVLQVLAQPRAVRGELQ